MEEPKRRAPRNRTLSITADEIAAYRPRLLRSAGPVTLDQIENTTICQDLFEIVEWLPRAAFDLLFLDPPYNLTRDFNGQTFRQQSLDRYAAWFEAWFAHLMPALKPTASVYICCDWRTSGRCR
jgi:site-specific DNA-methyltransferase (adenine-specific)